MTSIYRIGRLYVLIVLAVLAAVSPGGNARAGESLLKIGVLAVRGHEQCLESWSPTADYLSWKTGREFIIVPLAHDQVHSSVESGSVDFILTNSAMYVGLEHWFQASRIVTLKERRAGGVFTRYGGVVFCRSDRKDIRTLRDVKGRSFMAVSETSLGGWLMAWREFKEQGIDPYSDFKSLQFSQTHDQVVYAVRDGLVDAGTVRTNTLEALSAEGRINLADYYVFPPLHAEAFDRPYVCTTREYPDWPMARVRHTPDKLAEDVAIALIQMPSDSPAARAADCAGWTIPMNYQSVHECLKALKVDPYQDLGKITVKDVLQSYGHWILFAGAVFVILSAFTAMIFTFNRRIKNSNVRLKAEMDLRKQKDLELEQARDLAEAATRAKSEFLANMSHEIRTPMNGVIAATELALGEPVDPKVGQYLNIIQSSAYSLLGIINDILDFSKIEAGKFDLKERTFRLNELFDQVVDLFVNKALEKNIELLVDIDPDTPRLIIGDPLRLQQILTNLISNSVKFTDSGGVVTVHVHADKDAAPASEADAVILVFSVKDTGMGIAPEFLDRLFEPFTQADTSSTRKHEGTGLGLSICKQLTSLMEGTICVESQPGQGSTFTFTVKLRLPPERPASRLILPPDIQGLNVLVVDDLADSRLIMRKMLSSLGFRVETLASGPEALIRLKPDRMKDNPVELILMDWKMPEMDGIEVSRKIRQDLALTLPIIMMTAFGREEQRMAAEKAGINGFLVKPIYPSTLFDAIMDGFGKAGERQGRPRHQFTTRASIYRKPLKGMRILVAEDNPTNQKVARAILEGAGIDVTIVGHGGAAVEAVQQQSFDAVLMDIQMPLMNGYEATRRIRELPEGGLVPIVAMTAHAMKGDEEKCLEAGMDGYISKPVNQDRLFHTLWQLLRSRKGVMEWTETEEPETDTDSPDSGGPTLPDELPGLRIRETREAMNMDDATLARIMQGFLVDNRNLVDKLRQASADRDTESLRYLAHSLKGSAANIGAIELSKAAHLLEDTAQTLPSPGVEPNGFEDLIAGVADELGRVFISIRSLEAPADVEADSPGPDGTEKDFETLLDGLSQAVDRSDPEQIQILMPEIRRWTDRAKHPEPGILRALEDQIKRYDYDQALETIQKIRNHPGMEKDG